ncbi:MAG TPA: plasmid partition protein ParG [Leptolyngbyaceae cyanobacterium]
MSTNDEEKNVKLSIYLPEDMRARFKSACALHRKSMNEILVEFIDDFLKQNEPSAKTEDKGVA